MALVLVNSEHQQVAGVKDYQVAVDTATGRQYLVTINAAGAISATVCELTSGNPAQAGEAAAAVAGMDWVVSVTKRLTVSATSTLLPTLADVTLPANLKAITLAREETSILAIRHEYGEASATSTELPNGVFTLRTTKALADTLQLYAAGTAYVTLYVWTPRT